MAKFQLADMLKDVSELNTGREQIVYLDLDKLHPDPDNFYRLEGLEDLAANIELIGLQQPIRVRPNEDDSFTIVSGHRRRAAIQMIRDGGSDQFADGVPCIVELAKSGSRALQELRLIFANSSTRVISNAELSIQAERVNDLLYQLANEGMEFTGRMRAHVAAACKVSESKIARLHAIRANLNPSLLKFFDSGAMTEDAAYQLSRLPVDVQEAAADKIENDKKFKMPTGSVVQKINKQLASYDKARPCPAHAGGPQCHHLHDLRVRDLFQRYEWDVCSTSYCCMECLSRDCCRKACKEAKDKVKLEKAAQAEKDKARAEKRREEQTAIQRKICRRAEALLPMIEAAQLKDSQRLFDNYEAASAADVKAWANGETDGKTFYSENSLLPYFTRDVFKMAKLLKVSPGAVLDPFHPTETVKVLDAETLYTWRRAGIPGDGLYVCKFTLLSDDIQVGIFRRKGNAWLVGPSGEVPISRSCKIVAYYLLPEDET